MNRETNDRLILLALWLLVFSASSQIMIVSPMLPQIGRELNVPEAMRGTLVSAYALMVGIFALISGPISDRIGRRRILLAGSGAMTIALALHFVATDYVSLLAMRALAGAAGGILSGAAVSYVGDHFPYERRGWASGWIMSSTALGQILGVPLGTVLADRYGFRTPFLCFAVSMGLTFLFVWRFVPQPQVERSERRLSFGGALDNYRELLKRSEVLAGAAAFALMFMSLAFYVIYLPTWLTNERGATGTQIATLFLVGGIANALTNPIVGKLSDRIGRKSLIILSCVGLSIVMLSVVPLMRSLWIAYPVFFVTMILVAARMSPFQALLSSLAKGDQRGSLMSLTVSLGQVGFAVGGACAGFLFTRYGYLSNAVVGACCVLLMALIVWRFLPEPQLEKSAVTDGDEKSERDASVREAARDASAITTAA